MRLIDADALVNEFEIIEKARAREDLIGSFYAVPTIIDMVNSMQTHYPQVHAHWVFGNSGGHAWMKCSQCLVSQAWQDSSWGYCPNCGAVMDGKEEP